MSLKEKFFSLVSKTANCWWWQGKKDKYGYGRLNFNGHSFSAHRFSYNIHTGKVIPSGMFICHRCDNPSCVNPQHLFLGTPKTNTEDARKKCRLRGNHYPKSWIAIGGIADPRYFIDELLIRD